ncbi:MAG: hypothetical protein KF859_08465 [Phycisphaeraceae bacterium]|nr:hypothetical protein [Phycisphaeraceae bacterium]
MPRPRDLRETRVMTAAPFHRAVGSGAASMLVGRFMFVRLTRAAVALRQAGSLVL